MKFGEKNIKQAVELLKMLVSTPSVSRDESVAADKLQMFIERSTPVLLDIHRHGNNIWCIARDTMHSALHCCSMLT